MVVFPVIIKSLALLRKLEIWIVGDTFIWISRFRFWSYSSVLTGFQVVVTKIKFYFALHVQPITTDYANMRDFSVSFSSIHVNLHPRTAPMWEASSFCRYDLNIATGSFKAESHIQSHRICNLEFSLWECCTRVGEYHVPEGVLNSQRLSTSWWILGFEGLFVYGNLVHTVPLIFRSANAYCSRCLIRYIYRGTSSWSTLSTARE